MHNYNPCKQKYAKVYSLACTESSDKSTHVGNLILIAGLLMNMSNGAIYELMNRMQVELESVVMDLNVNYETLSRTIRLLQ